ncbi:MAG: hypothetical protein Q9183_002348 [Haloplaca sp. 2 TL-2023]
MEPVTAFGLVAGVIQVVDISFKAIARCRELYKDGSLAEHRETREITDALRMKSQLGTLCPLALVWRSYNDVEYPPLLSGKRDLIVDLPHSPVSYRQVLTDFLVQASKALNDSLPDLSAPLFAPQANEDVEVLTLSKKCYTVAKDILSEMERLKPDRQGLRQTVSKGVRTMMISSTLKDKQAKLERYQQALDTRILIRLDARSLREPEGFHSLGRDVQKLAAAIERGHKTMAGLLAYHQREILDHFDRRFDDFIETENQHEILERFQDSLFSPEIHSRQEQIQKRLKGHASGSSILRARKIRSVERGPASANG